MPNHNDTPVITLLAQHGHCPVSENRRSEKDRWRFICPIPGHHDTHPSFTVSENGDQWTCWACGQVLQGIRRLRELLGGPAITPVAKSAKPPKRKKYKPEPLQGAILQALSLRRDCPWNTSNRWAGTTHITLASQPLPSLIPRVSDTELPSRRKTASAGGKVVGYRSLAQSKSRRSAMLGGFCLSRVRPMSQQRD